MATDTTSPLMTTWTNNIGTPGKLYFGFNEPIQLGSGTISIYLTSDIDTFGDPITGASPLESYAVGVDPNVFIITDSDPATNPTAIPDSILRIAPTTLPLPQLDGYGQYTTTDYTVIFDLGSVTDLAGNLISVNANGSIFPISNVSFLVTSTAYYDYSTTKVALNLNLMTDDSWVKNASSADPVYWDSLVGIQNIIAGPMNDTLRGDGSANRLEGRGGNDTLDGRAGANGNDRLYGGIGNDSYIIDSTSEKLVEFLSEGTDEVKTSVDWTLGANFENLTLTGANDLNGNGNTGANIITGNSGNNVLSGGAGNDTLDGGTGDDTLTGGIGDDRFNFATSGSLTSADVVDGEAGNDTLAMIGNTAITATDFTKVTNIETITVDNTTSDIAITTVDPFVPAGVTFNFNPASLTTGTLDFNGSAETDGNFSITGGAANDTIIGGDLNDTLAGGSGNDSLAGGNGNDTFSFAAGTGLTANDTVNGGAGNDTVALTGNTAIAATSFTNVRNIETITVTNTTANVAITATDLLVSTAATLTLNTAGTLTGTLNFDGSAETDGNFSLTSGTGSDTISTGLGDDTITSGLGADSLTGGSGDDVFIFVAGTGLTNVDTVNGGSGNDTVKLTGNTAIATTNFDKVSNISAITVQNTTANIAIITVDALVASGATLTLDASSTLTTGTLTFRGNLETNGHFKITSGGTGNDSIVGGAGNDTISSSTGTDTLTGGAGDDVFIFAAGALTSIDTVDGTTGNDTVALTGNTAIAATNFDGVSNITAITVANTTTNVAITTKDILVATATVLALDASSLTTGTLNFNGALETNGRFSITGGAGNDTITGGAGNDTITAGIGNDSLIGGNGNDVFIFSVGPGLSSTDTVNGGAGTDTLNLTGNAAIAINDFSNVSNIENITIANTTTNVVMTTTDAFVAAGATLAFDASSLTTGTLNFNGSAETNGSFNVSGGAANDTMVGGAGSDSFAGGSGDDSFTFVAGTGLTSADAIDGGAGNDTLILTGNSAVAATNFTNVSNIETITISHTTTDVAITPADTLVAAGTTLTLDASSLTTGTLAFNGAAETNGSFDIKGGAANDTMTGSAQDDSLAGGANHDSITAGAGNDFVTGGGGDDIFVFAAGIGLTSADTVNGGMGNDTLGLTGNSAIALTDFDNVSNIEAIIVGNTTTNIAITTTDAFVVTAASLSFDASSLTTGTLNFDGSAETDGQFGITGGAANDTMMGGGLDDTLAGGSGNDSLTGGVGNDSFVFAAGAAGLTSLDTVKGGAGTDTLNLTGNAAIAINDFSNVSNIENITIANTTTNVAMATPDAFVTAGATLAFNAASLTTGRLNFDGSAETDGKFNITGGAANDTFTFIAGTGFGSTDTIDGGAGNDTVVLTGDTAIAATDFNNVSNIEVINSANVTTNIAITTVDALVAAGAILTLDASALTTGILNFNGSAETAGSFSLTGGNANDSITGGTLDDTIASGSGNDSLIGRNGNDTFIFAAGAAGLTSADTVNGGLGIDTLSLTSNVAITATDFDNVSNIEAITLANTTTNIDLTTVDTFVAAGVAFTFDASSLTTGTLNFNGTAETDGRFTVLGGGSTDVIVGSTGDDSLNGGASNDTITGGAGNDTLTGGGNSDRFNLDAGTDTVTDLSGSDALNIAPGVIANATLAGAWTASATNITSNAGTATVDAAGSAITLTNAIGLKGWTLTNSGAGTTMIGSDQKDTISGGTGNDSLTGGAGDDSLTGGLGVDSFTVDSGIDAIADLGTGGAEVLTVNAGAEANATLGAAWVATAASTNAGAALTGAVITANDLNANLTAINTGNGWTVTNTGNAIGVTLWGSAIAASGDSIIGGAGFDVLNGNAGNDSLDGSAGNDNLTGGAGNDSLTGGIGIDTFNVDSGSDVISDLGDGADILTVGSAVGTTANAKLTGAWTSTSASSNAGAASIDANGFGVSLAALAGTSTKGWTLTNSGVAATMTGSIQVDTMTGGAGNDTLNGGKGGDMLTGGLGSDTFVFATGDTALTIGGTGTAGTIAGYDVITGFALANGTSTSEKIDLPGTAALIGNTTSFNGTNSTLKLNTGAVVTSHKVANRIITFDDGGNTFASAVSLTSLADVAAVVQYLQLNDIGNASTTTIFTATIGGTAHTYLYSQGDAGGTNSLDTLIDLVGVSALSVATANATTNGLLFIA
jgi:Ca2+-binding RTX toxin-like protein